MEGYRPESYGDAIADVYDDWYRDLGDLDALVSFVVDELAGDCDAGGGELRLLELGVGTGRLAIPLSAAGLDVTGIDASTAMTDRLRANDPDGAVSFLVGDMVDDFPQGPFDGVLLGYNTLFNLLTPERQSELFVRVAANLTPAGCLIVEAFVPGEPPRHGGRVEVRSITADAVVLSASLHDPFSQRADGQFIEITEAGGVRLRPWSIRYAAPDELDEMAAAAGMQLSSRHEDALRKPFDDDAERHLSVYRLTRR